MSQALQPPRPTALDVYRQILVLEGASHVAGRYIADALLCEYARWEEAERRVRDTERLAAYLATRPATIVCRWCEQVAPAAGAVTIGDAVVCAPCIPAYEALVFGAPLAPVFEAAPLDETDALVVECEHGIGDAYAHGVAHGESVGEPQGAFVATLREMGRAA